MKISITARAISATRGNSQERSTTREHNRPAAQPPGQARSNKGYVTAFQSPQVPIARRKPKQWDPVRQTGILIYKLTCGVRCRNILIGCRRQTWNHEPAPIRFLDTITTSQFIVEYLNQERMLSPPRRARLPHTPAPRPPIAPRSLVRRGYTLPQACQPHS